MRKSVSVPEASPAVKEISSLRSGAGLFAGLFCGAAMIFPLFSSHADAQQAQGAWAVPAAQAQQGVGGQQTKGGVAVLPPSPTGKLANPFPSAVIGTPEKPLSSKMMPVDGAKIDGQINKAIQDADERLKGVSLSSGNTSVAALPVPTLNDDIRAAAMIHRMQVQRAEVQGAVDLWGAAYDGKRETPPVGQNGTPGGGYQAGMTDAGGGPISQPQSDPMDRIRQARAEEASREEADAAARKAEDDRRAAELRKKRQEMAAMLPVVSSIAGDPHDAVATILVPFVGERQGMMAGDTIQTFSGRMMTIRSVTADGVTVQEGRRLFHLPSGSVAPSPAQGVAMLTSISAPAPTPRMSGVLQSSGNMAPSRGGMVGGMGVH